MKTHLDLFSGIGGFALACRWNNIQTIGFCEIEDYPRRVLERHFPDVRIHRDIRDLDGSGYKGVSLITAGLPCQPFSRAGKQRGQEDDRWLWSEMRRVVIEAQPTYLIIENVAGFIDLALDTVCADLEAEDYATGTVVLGAASVNAPHRRQRIWCLAKRLAHSTSVRCAERLGTKMEGGNDATGEEAESGSKGCSSSKSKDVAHPPIHGTQGLRASGIEESHPPAGQEVSLCRNEGRSSTDSSFKSHLGRGSDGLSERLDFPRRWGDGSWEEGVPRVTLERKNRTARLKALGNAIVPQIAYELIRCMKEIDESE